MPREIVQFKPRYRKFLTFFSFFDRLCQICSNQTLLVFRTVLLNLVETSLNWATSGHFKVQLKPSKDHDALINGFLSVDFTRLHVVEHGALQH